MRPPTVDDRGLYALRDRLLEKRRKALQALRGETGVAASEGGVALADQDVVRDPKNYVQRARNILIEEVGDTLEEGLADLYALLLFSRGSEVTAEEVHDAWSLWRDRSKPDHKSLIPFAELEPDVQRLDDRYVNAIKRAAQRLAEEREEDGPDASA